jgi:paraquat-inducible protein A
MTHDITPPTLSGPGSDTSSRPAFTCRLCGLEHVRVRLGRGRRALCVRCGSLLAKRGWLGRDAALAFTLTGVLLAAPAFTLPIMTVGKYGNSHADLVVSGVQALWEDRMRLLSIWVLLCGVVAPLLLLGTLAGLLLAPRQGWPPSVRRALARSAHALEHWAMPEVHVLAVLVALVKLGSQVDVHLQPGFWCYATMSAMVLLAWRTYALERAAGLETVEP